MGDDGKDAHAGPKVDLHYGHPRMPLSERAKIFVPFDPLKGFREALAEQERLAEQEHEQARDGDVDAP